MICGGGPPPGRLDRSSASSRRSTSPPSRPGPGSGCVYLTTIGSLVGFTTYVWLLRVAPLPKIATYAYVNPVVAFVLAGILLGEAIEPRTVVAGAVIIFAVALIVTAARAPSRRGTRGRPARERPAGERRPPARPGGPPGPSLPRLSASRRSALGQDGPADTAGRGPSRSASGSPRGRSGRATCPRRRGPARSASAPGPSGRRADPPGGIAGMGPRIGPEPGRAHLVGAEDGSRGSARSRTGPRRASKAANARASRRPVRCRPARCQAAGRPEGDDLARSGRPERSGPSSAARGAASPPRPDRPGSRSARRPSGSPGPVRSRRRG